MEAVILAGGLGTRLRPVLDNIPKVMAPIAGKPFLWYLLQQLRRQQVVDVCLSVGYLYRPIADHFGDGSCCGVKISYSIEHTPLGTAGAVKKAARMLPSHFLVLNGDSYLDVRFEDLVNFHAARKSLITIALSESKEPSRYGSVQLGPDNRILDFREKYTSGDLHLINAGVYVIDKTIFDDIPEDVPASLETDVLPRYANQSFYGLKIPGFFVDIGTPSSYQHVKNGFLQEVLK